MGEGFFDLFLYVLNSSLRIVWNTVVHESAFHILLLLDIVCSNRSFAQISLILSPYVTANTTII